MQTIRGVDKAPRKANKKVITQNKEGKAKGSKKARTAKQESKKRSE